MSTSAKKCRHIPVSPFSDGDRMAYAERLGFSVRGDELWTHCDAAGRILEIELLGDDKGTTAHRSVGVEMRSAVTDDHLLCGRIPMEVNAHGFCHAGLITNL